MRPGNSVRRGHSAMTTATATPPALSAAHVSKTFASPAGAQRRLAHDRSRRDPRPRRSERLRQVDVRQDPRRLPRARSGRRRRGRRAARSTSVRRPPPASAGLRFVHQNLGLIDAHRRGRQLLPRGRQTGVGKLDRRAERRRAPARPSSDSASRSTPTAMVVDARRVRAHRGRRRPGARRHRAQRAAAGARRADGVAARARGRPPVRRPAPHRRRAAPSILFISHHLDEVLGLCRPGDGAARRPHGRHRRRRTSCRTTRSSS